MSQIGREDTRAIQLPPPTDAAGRADGQIAEITSLLSALQDAPATAFAPRSLPLTDAQENQLVQVRTGVASSLFNSLRWKHEPTARHCLRVAFLCSSWAMKMGLSGVRRDEIELAALLHDIGKIGVPDAILTKPNKLTPQEMSVVENHWVMGREILRSSCSSQVVMNTMTLARAWYDGSKTGFTESGDAIPLGARMLSIADAYDAMTSDHVYRRALSSELALHELYRFAGAQFDPKLVELFRELHECDQLHLQERVARQWLRDLDPDAANAAWRLSGAADADAARSLTPETIFQQKMLENMYDGVIFLNTEMRVLLWNRGAERLTGISGESMRQRRLLPSVLDLQDENGRTLLDEQCPITESLKTGAQWLRRVFIRGRSGRSTAVSMHAVPILGQDGAMVGITVLMHDVSPEISLEERCQSLHAKATQDPLTSVANRAEFDRVHELFVAAHLESKRPCALIMSDIDRFKSVNDTFGHQAGDEVIQSFARVLRGGCRQGDLVARYGGEEFVMLYADCDVNTAVRRADDLRKAFHAIAQPLCGGKCVSASFGVTEVQAGDTPETMLRRADRALMNAKESGRNMVIQLGSGAPADEAPAKASWFSWGKVVSAVLVEQRLISVAPMNVSLEKLRGFVADHEAEVEHIGDNDVRMTVLDGRRSFADRPLRLSVELNFEEHEVSTNSHGRPVMRTRIHVVVKLSKNRDRRVSDATDRGLKLLSSIRAYLMATIDDDDDADAAAATAG